ncbi:DNA polymerase III subunit gamma/tau [Paraglaciecola marina]|uniref:DNA polymerase III subunit gamma/tau n=1 Tax=Paraglaciecola marina TaxID=2500157 RepID=UPI00105BFCCD|nr:DNA polymerase III subunit gamma/tau [Paraglaciecola marina]
MSYQVLARKWRPNRFGELVGQEHVVTAISNALDNDRLHHAYLFTGTRGVGKTTIARIFSKSLNCEQGLGSTPCGLCSTCKEIEQGHFIDLLEIDAASRTKVEDTRELLDNVQYKPSRGRYKVYLIDEVHMLSKHSFNALLKTLEEPPPHVKFLLATTDPQKLPVTILSRCLQFNLKALSRAQISQQLDFVLGQEQIPFEKEALAQLARAAQGSMRDALSLTDQAIAQGNGQVSLQIVTDMLGLMDKNQVIKVVNAIVQKDSASVMQQVELMAQQAPDFSAVLAEVMSLLHQIALTQFVPEACKLETIAARAIYQLAKSAPAEQIQLLYQIALTGRKDLPYAADPRTGFEMTLLRMLAFCPAGIKLNAEDIAEQTAEQAPVDIPNAIESTRSAAIERELVTATSPQEEHIQPAEEAQVELKAEAAPIVEEPEAIDSSVSVDIQEASDNEVALNTQQQEILNQAQDYGYEPIDYDQMTPVGSEEKVATHTSDDDFVPSNEQASVPSPAKSTAELIALRNRFKENQSQGEGSAPQVKKSDPEDSPLQNGSNLDSPVSEPLASKKITNQSTELESTAGPEVKPNPFSVRKAQLPSQPASVEPVLAPQLDKTADNPVQQNEMPPWPVDDSFQSENIEKSGSERFSEEVVLEVESTQVFDPNAHLDIENVGEVTVTIPAFLEDNQKVIHSQQVDDWSKLIYEMQVTALTKQLALHSAFEQEGNVIKLTLLDSKAHLDSPSARQQLSDAICGALNTSVELEIQLGKPINTPYALQMEINKVRKTYAKEVIHNDNGIKLLQELFNAKVDEQSILAR